MNIWRVSCTHEERTLVAVVVALTPAQARGMVARSPSFEQVSEGTDACVQLGTAATNFNQPEIILIQLVE